MIKIILPLILLFLIVIFWKKIDDFILNKLGFKTYKLVGDKNYKEINFDGSKKQNNFYLAIYPNQFKKMCTTDDLIGEWKVVFRGTDYDNIKFRVSNEVIVPGEESRYEPVC